ncbi:4-hydroxyproline epimerase [Flavobacterium collinsii]|jgi:4-hydroxyproline epimerase|uniref:4-hydroxyproline 2-epimerase n=1 Tax=Flavobacterium collinsii TaxID=1114861 RepID=A0A9W4TE61_9FLAO|nr:4-hydroxyproline epimerase [Flavobacterium collinsii]GIQ58461.1 hydroxyproline-2-epimerase [Flavobacterium collinsii]CAA9194922.1 4-hydroxyproline 2-epimerase [Flavobacterium collinsii]CAI2765291.1 4-hydroxyproline 2-epimerase [Flavobacterium collinsii]
MVKKTFFCVDAHTCGNPVRVVAGGGPNLTGANMSEKRQHFLKEFDWIRKGLMFEPRGHDMMSGSILYPPSDPANDFGILFIETSGCLPMCGHGTIGTITIAIEEGLITPKIPGKIRMEAPAGLVNIEYQQTGNKVDWVRLTNVKSYLAAEGLTIDCPELGEITFDVAYGGNYYAIVDPQQNFSGIQDFSAGKIVQLSQEVRKRINAKYPDYFIHPENDTIRDVSHMLWTGEPLDPTSSGRNAVFYGDKAIDRSPCGTGTSARIAQLHAKGKLKVGEDFIHESYIGSKFIGKVVEETSIGDIPAIVPSIQGWAKVYGYNTIIIDEANDPYAHGFQVI